MAEYELPHQTCLRESREFLLENISASLDRVVDCVYGKGHLTEEEKQQIDYEPGGPIAKTRKFLDIISRKTDAKVFNDLQEKFRKEKSSSHVYVGLKRKLEEITKNWKEDDRPRIKQQSKYTCFLTYLITFTFSVLFRIFRFK